MDRPHHITVLTGDIVGSTALGTQQVQAAMQALAQSAALQQGWHHAPLQFAQHRGDGWQVVLHRPELALRSALTLHAAIRSLGKEFTTRIASATAPFSGSLNADLNTENQPAFIASGKLLETMSRKDQGTYIQTADGGASAPSFILADHIAASWTPPQAQVMGYMLRPTPDVRPLTQIGKALGKSRQAVTKSVDGAGGFALQEALRVLEKALLDD